MKFLMSVKSGVNRVAKKTFCVGMAAVSAVSMLAMSAFAEDSSGVIDTVTSEMTTQLSNVAAKAGVAIAGVIGVGLSIFAVKWLVGVVKSFFSKLAK